MGRIGRNTRQQDRGHWFKILPFNKLRMRYPRSGSVPNPPTLPLCQFRAKAPSQAQSIM